MTLAAHKVAHLAMFAEAIADVVGIDPAITKQLKGKDWQDGLKALTRRIADLANEARKDTPDHRAIKERFMRDLIYLQECTGFDDVQDKLLDIMSAVSRTDFDALATDHLDTLRRVDNKLAGMAKPAAPVSKYAYIDAGDRSV